MTQQDPVWIERFDGAVAGEGDIVVAVKDLIDVAGSVTTAACRAVAESGEPAKRDAPCVALVRAGGARLAGKVNLHELAFGVSGVNVWYGTPPNPIDPGRIPGGSSSGSAVAVASGDADFALGSDTGGSVRVPAACCGVVGLKTTFGRIPVDGVRPLAPSYDTVGPLARNVAGVVAAMQMLDPFGWRGPSDAPSVARARFQKDVQVDPLIDAAVDAALASAELELERVHLDGWAETYRDQQLLLVREAWESNRELIESTGGDGIGELTCERLGRGAAFSEDELAGAGARTSEWGPAFVRLVERFGVVAMPALPCRPPLIEEPVLGFNIFSTPVNLVGLPAISVPIPVGHGRAATGLQLVAAAGGEEVLVGVAARIEAAVSG